jgi:hypothetical protein
MKTLLKASKALLVLAIFSASMGMAQDQSKDKQDKEEPPTASEKEMPQKRVPLRTPAIRRKLTRTAILLPRLLQTRP